MIDFSYYALYLKKYLTDAGDARKDDDEFINARGDMGAGVLESERRTMDRLLSFLKEHGHPVDQWYYSYFHESWHSEIDGVRYNMLDCMELRELR